MDVDEPRGGDLSLDGEDVGAWPDDQAGCNVHGFGVSGLADPRDLAVPHADIAFDDPKQRVDEHRVCDNEVEGTVGPLEPRNHAHSVANRLATAEDELVTIGGQISLDLGHEPGISEVDAVAGGRPVLRRVIGTIDQAAHDVLPVPCSLAGRAGIDFVRPPMRHIDVPGETIALLPGILDCLCPCQFAALGAVSQVVHSPGHLGPAEARDLNLAALAWLEADRGTTRNVEAESERSRPVERQGTVNLEEMVMSADLDRAITSIYDF